MTDDRLKQHTHQLAKTYAAQLGIDVDFADGRRNDDITIVRAHGTRRLGRVLYNHLVDELPGVHVELFESNRVSSEKTLIAVSRPSTSSAEHERRARLKGRSARSQRAL